MVHSLGSFVPETDQSVLVHYQRMGEHVTSKIEIELSQIANTIIFFYGLLKQHFLYIIERT